MTNRLNRFFNVESIIDMRDTSLPIYGYICLSHKTDLLKENKKSEYVICEVGYETECVNCTEISKSLRLLNINPQHFDEWLYSKFNEYLLETENHG
jgi:hypothetical protein